MPLGLVEKVKKEKRLGEVSPEEGSQFYQPEEVTRSYKNDEFFAQVLKQGQSPKSQGRRLAVTGEPGAGKTTLLQKIAQWVAAETEQDVAIWVSLADLQGRNVEEYLQQKWLKDALGAVRVTPEMEEALALLFNSGRVWLLLDGVDEMGSSNPLATVANQISGWVASARVVVTCRQNVWDAGKNALEGFDVYRNLDFDYPEGVGQFIEGWFACQRELGERLLKELAQGGKERIRDTVRNPLRLALLCRAWQNRQGGLPETKAGLYGQFAEALYEWKQEAFPTKSKQRKDLNAALGSLALRGMEQSESRFRLREGLVTEILGETDEPLCQLALQLGWLNLVGVAVENPDERVYAFYHPTFQEYFAALAVDDWGYFLHHVPDNPSLGTYRIFEKQWKEVILLWFGRGDVQKEKKEAFIEKLVNFDDGCGDWNYPQVDKGFYEYQAYFLAGAVLPEFKESRFADEIVEKNFRFGFGYFDIYKYEEWEKFNSIAKMARTSISETLKQKVIANLIKVLNKDNDAWRRWNSKSIAGDLTKIIVDNQAAIDALINICPREDSFILSTLGEIAVSNERAINFLIQFLETIKIQHIRRDIANTLGKIAIGNKAAVRALNQALKATKGEYTRWCFAENLEKTNPGNEVAIRELIQIFETTRNFSTFYTLSEILSKFAVYNKFIIEELTRIFIVNNDEYKSIIIAKNLTENNLANNLLICQLLKILETTNSVYTLTDVAEIIEKLEPGNELAIKSLICILKTDKNEYNQKCASECLQKIAVGNTTVIRELIKLMGTDRSEYFRSCIAHTLIKIDSDNELAIEVLVSILENTQSKKIRTNIVEILEKNDLAIKSLISLLKITDSEDTRSQVAESLGKIAVGNEGAINRLILLLDETSDEDTRSQVAESLGKIAVGNEGAINRLILLLDETSDEDTRSQVAKSLGKITVTKQQYFQLIYALQPNFKHKCYKNNCNLYEQSYELIWQCAQNLTYPEFYKAWHQKPSNLWQNLWEQLNRPIF